MQEDGDQRPEASFHCEPQLYVSMELLWDLISHLEIEGIPSSDLRGSSDLIFYVSKAMFSLLKSNVIIAHI